MKKIFFVFITLFLFTGCSSSSSFNLNQTFTSENYRFNYSEDINVMDHLAGSPFISLNIENTSSTMIISEVKDFASFGDSIPEKEKNFLMMYNGDLDAEFKDVTIGGINARSLHFKDSQTNLLQRMVFLKNGDDLYLIRYNAQNRQNQNLFDAVIDSIVFTNN